MRRLERLGERLNVDPYAIIGLVATAAVLLLVVMTYNGTLRNLFNGGDPEVTAIFADARTLTKGDPVRVKGVKVGLVQKVESVEGGRGSKVWMTMDPSAGNLHRDAHAKVAYRTLLGGAFVVNIDPGRPETGALDGPIPMRQTSNQVELDDITTVVRGAARNGLRTLPRELSKTMEHPDVLANLGTTVADEARPLQKGLHALRGTNEADDLTRLARQTAKAVRALDAPDDELRQVVAGAAATLHTTANRQGDLRSTIGRAPGVMAETKTTLSDLDTTLDLAEPVVRRLQKPAGEVAPSLRALRPVLGGADKLLGRADPLLGQLRPAVRSLATTARQGIPLLDELDPSLDRLDKTILPYMNEIDPQTQHSAAEMVGPGLGGLGNVAAGYDSNGHYLRFPATAGSSPLYLPCQTYINNPDKAAAVECESLQEVIKSFTSWNPLGPTPGSAPAPAKKGK